MVANRVQARFCRWCKRDLAPFPNGELAEAVLAGLWSEAEVERLPEPFSLAVPTGDDPVTALGEAGGFLLVGTQGGRVLAYNALWPGEACAQARVGGRVLGFAEWAGGPAAAASDALAPGALVSTTTGVFHLPFVTEPPVAITVPENGEGFAAPAFPLGGGVLAFPGAGGGVAPTYLRFPRGRAPEIRRLEPRVGAPIAGPTLFGESRAVFLADGQALHCEPGSPDVVRAVRLANHPDPHAAPAASETDLFYVYQVDGRRGVARLPLGESTSYRVTPPDYPVVQLAVVSSRGICIGTGDDLAILPAAGGTAIWSRKRDQLIDTLAHDRFPPLRVRGHLLVCSIARSGMYLLEVVPLTPAGFRAGLKEVLRLPAFELPPRVVPGGVVVAARGGLVVLRPRPR